MKNVFSFIIIIKHTKQCFKIQMKDFHLQILNYVYLFINVKIGINKRRVFCCCIWNVYMYKCECLSTPILCYILHWFFFRSNFKIENNNNKSFNDWTLKIKYNKRLSTFHIKNDSQFAHYCEKHVYFLCEYTFLWKYKIVYDEITRHQ